MAPAIGTPDFSQVGGEIPAFAIEHGNYHVIVQDSAKTEAKTGREMIRLTLYVKGDPNHAAREGKKLCTDQQALAAPDDDPDKAANMKRMLKRRYYDGFSVAWPTKGGDLDPRVFVGKEAWVQIGDNKQADGTLTDGVVAIAPTVDKLPKPKASNGVAAPGVQASSNGASGGGKRARR